MLSWNLLRASRQNLLSMQTGQNPKPSIPLNPPSRVDKKVDKYDSEQFARANESLDAHVFIPPSSRVELPRFEQPQDSYPEVFFRESKSGEGTGRRGPVLSLLPLLLETSVSLHLVVPSIPPIVDVCVCDAEDMHQWRIVPLILCSVRKCWSTVTIHRGS